MRRSVSASIKTVGESPSSERAIVSGLGRPVIVAPGRCAMTPAPGEKPSLSLKGAGSVGPGNVVGPNSTWRRVGIVASETVHTFDGNGNAQAVGTSGSQSPASHGPSPGPVGSGTASARPSESEPQPAAAKAAN